MTLPATNGSATAAASPIEPEGIDGRDRFDVRADTAGLCPTCLDHQARGDLIAAVARAVLERAGEDTNGTLNGVLASTIAARLP